MFYFHSIFIIYLILFYLNDSVGLTKKNAISPRLLCYATVILAFHHCTGSQQSASRGRVLAFYRIAPCLKVERGFILFTGPVLFSGSLGIKWTSFKSVGIIFNAISIKLITITFFFLYLLLSLFADMYFPVFDTRYVFIHFRGLSLYFYA